MKISVALAAFYSTHRLLTISWRSSGGGAALPYFIDGKCFCHGEATWPEESLSEGMACNQAWRYFHQSCGDINAGVVGGRRLSTIAAV